MRPECDEIENSKLPTAVSLNQLNNSVSPKKMEILVVVDGFFSSSSPPTQFSGLAQGATQRLYISNSARIGEGKNGNVSRKKEKEWKKRTRASSQEKKEQTGEARQNVDDIQPSMSRVKIFAISCFPSPKSRSSAALVRLMGGAE